MSPLRIGILVAALAIAGLVAFLVSQFLESQTATQDDQGPSIPVVKVLVADKNLPAGTKLLGGEFEGHLRWQSWPDEGINPSWVTLREGEDSAAKKSQFVGTTVKRGIVAGEPMTMTRVVKAGSAGFMAGALGAGQRAVSIAIRPSSAVAGFVVPGSHVDIMLTKQWKETDPATGVSKSRHVSETILENVKIIAIDQHLDDINANAVVGKNATIEVSPKQAEKIAVAKSMGKLSLALRSLRPAERETKPDPFTSELEVSRFLSRDPGVRPPILVARHDLKSGSLLTDADSQWRAAAAGLPDEGLIIKGRFNESGLRGALVTRDYKKGEPITEASLVKTGAQGFLTAALGAGMRAISLAVTDVSGVSGYISPGDRVDVVLTHSLKDNSENAPLSSRKFSETIFRDVRILAIEQTVDESSGKPVIGRTATLELTPMQAEAAFLATSMGSLSLALRGRRADAHPSDRAFTSDLDISRAAWELIRGLNRFGPGAPPEVAQPVSAIEPEKPGMTAQPIAPAPASRGRERVKVRVYRAVGASTISIAR